MIPVLDLLPLRMGEDGAEARLSARLLSALKNIGFFAITNHGISGSLIEEMFQQARRFHMLPLEQKMSLKLSLQMTGYQALGEGYGRASKVPGANVRNTNEAFFVQNKTDVDQWPEELHGFREKVSEYFLEIQGLASRLLPLFETALGLSCGYFQDRFRDGRPVLRLVRYPVVDTPEECLGSAPHTDSGFITLLPDNEVEGLAIRQNGVWRDVPRLPNSILINSGDILKRWTNDLFLSTEHMVRRSLHRERYAIPFFFSPGRNVVVECLPTCKGPGNPARYPPVTVGRYLDWFRGQNFHGRPTEPAP